MLSGLPPAMVASPPESPRAPCSRAPIPDLLLSAERRERPGGPACYQGTRGDYELGDLRSEWSGMAALAQIAGIAPPPSAPGAEMREGDLLTVP
jgi:hypothetical protein